MLNVSGIIHHHVHSLSTYFTRTTSATPLQNFCLEVAKFKQVLNTQNKQHVNPNETWTRENELLTPGYQIYQVKLCWNGLTCLVKTQTIKHFANITKYQASRSGRPGTSGTTSVVHRVSYIQCTNWPSMHRLTDRGWVSKEGSVNYVAGVFWYSSWMCVAVLWHLSSVSLSAVLPPLLYNLSYSVDPQCQSLALYKMHNTNTS